MKNLKKQGKQKAIPPKNENLLQLKESSIMNPTNDNNSETESVDFRITIEKKYRSSLANKIYSFPKK